MKTPSQRCAEELHASSDRATLDDTDKLAWQIADTTGCDDLLKTAKDAVFSMSTNPTDKGWVTAMNAAIAKAEPPDAPELTTEPER